jgi:hypothetical protein
MSSTQPQPVTMQVGKFTAEVTVEYVPCPPHHAPAWRAGRKLLWQMILEAYRKVEAERAEKTREEC